MKDGTYKDRAAVRFDRLPWPGPDDEAWKRTPVRAVAFDRFKPYAFSPEETQDQKAGRLYEPSGESAGEWEGEIVFTAGRPTSFLLSPRAVRSGVRFEKIGNGREPRPVSGLLDKAEERIEDRVQARQLAELSHGAALTVPKNSSFDKPFLILFREMGNAALASPHLAVLLGEGARADIVARFSVPREESLLVNAGISLSAGENASLGFTLDDETGPGTRFFATLRAFISENASLSCTEVHIGQGIVKTQGSFDLEGPGSSVRLYGACLVGEGGHVETGTVQRHVSPRASSNSLYKGVIHPKGRSVFQGLITVEEGAAKTDAYLSNKNLLLGKGARADSIPRLVIKNDDVRCTHGSTTGKIDPGELFYLRSRGLPPDEAKRLIVTGFFEDALKAVPPSARKTIEERIAAALGPKDRKR
jgi:Fe-S cluster assembly protein SufD